MTREITFLFLGLANGAAFAALGLAIVVTYRSSGVVNFSASVMAYVTAYVFTYLRKGQLVFLFPGMPKPVRLADSLGFWPAALLALAISALLGLVLHLLVYRPLRSAPIVAKAVASLGVLLVLQSSMAIRQGVTIPSVPPIFPDEQWHIGSVDISQDRVYFAVTIVAVALLYGAMTRYTRFGLQTRASASSEKGAFVSGLSPDRIASVNAMISAVVAGIAGILIAPIVPPVPSQYALFIVPALAIAMLGGFERLAPVVAGGLLIGMAQSEMQWFQAKYSSVLPSSGLVELVPLVVIVLTFVVRAKPLPSRGAVALKSLGRAPRPRMMWTPMVVFSAIALVFISMFGSKFRSGLTQTLIMILIGLSYVVVVGYSGQVSLAQLTLAGVAGFLTAAMSTGRIGVTVPFPFAPILAALAASAIGLLIAWPAVRIRGLHVAVLTLSMAVAIEALWFRNVDFVSSYGEEVRPPELFGLDLDIGSGLVYPRRAFTIMCLVVVLLVAFGVAKLRRSRLGAAMLAVRANERSAAAAGIDVVRTKLIAFVIGSFIAGLGGSLLAYKLGTITVDEYRVFNNLFVFAGTYLAGITSIMGGIASGIMAQGGLLYAWIGEAIDFGKWYGFIGGLGLVLTVLVHPEGLTGRFHFLVDTVRSIVLRRRSVASAPEPDDATPRQHTLSLVHSDRAGGTVLELEGVTVRYGGVVAVNDVSFGVPRGAIVGLIGPNGAGKTTLLDAISGFAPCSGRVTLEGQRIDGVKAHRRTRAGLGRTFQAIELYEDMTVTENVEVGQGFSGRSSGDANADLEQALHLLGLTDVRDERASDLSHGRRQLVSIARALVGRPAVLLLDEPAGGLDSMESAWLADRLRVVRDSGTSILLIDHDMHFVLGLCDEIRVLNFGTLIASGTPAEVRADRKVTDAYLGTAHADVRAEEQVST